MINDFSVDMNEYLPLRDVVFNTLRKAILKGELKPGERLMEIALAERLGVSRTPVREAMRKLELEGLVVMIPRRGAQVANITEKDLNDVLEVRIALENLSIENACARMTEEQLAELWKAAKDFEATMAEGNLVKLAEADVAFHEVIYKSSDNRRLNQVLNNLREQIYRYRVEYLKDEETRNLLVKEHEEIYEAIRNRDVKQAQEISYQHIENQREAIIRSIREETQNRQVHQIKRSAVSAHIKSYNLVILKEMHKVYLFFYSQFYYSRYLSSGGNDERSSRRTSKRNRADQDFVKSEG